MKIILLIVLIFGLTACVASINKDCASKCVKVCSK